MNLKLFELVGTDASRPFSPFCWRTRMALAHKGLTAESLPWRFTEKGAIARHGAEKVSKTPFRIIPRCSAGRAAAPWRGC
jgi:glutathione S-transferase